MPPHCAADMAPVPESVSRSMRTSSALSRKRLQAADCRAAARCARVVNRMGSTVLMRNGDRKSTRLNSSHQIISYAVFCLKKKRKRAITENFTDELGLQT